MGDQLPTVDLGTGKKATQIAVGTMFSCALLDDATVKCWGYNGAGQLGLGDKLVRGDEPGEIGDNLPAIELGAGKTAVSIALGWAHACAVLNDGSLKCWGFNYPGQLGIGDSVSRGDNPSEMGDNLPAVKLGTVAPIKAVAAGYQHTCALFTDGSMKCWGGNFGGALGVGDSVHHGDEPWEMGDKLPLINLGTGKTAMAIDAAEYHTCAVLTDETVRCWGEGSYGRLGRENTNAYGYLPSHMGDQLPFVALGTGKKVKSITTYDRHSCAMLTDGSVKCWGNNGSGQCGYASPGTTGGQPGTMGDVLPMVKIFSNEW